MLPQEQLRKALEDAIDARVAEAFREYEKHVESGSKDQFHFSKPRLNDAARRLQSALAVLFKGPDHA